MKRCKTSKDEIILMILILILILIFARKWIFLQESAKISTREN